MENDINKIIDVIDSAVEKGLQKPPRTKIIDDYIATVGNGNVRDALNVALFKLELANDKIKELQDTIMKLWVKFGDEIAL